MNPLVSIIIPVYNTEKYLDMCITSVLKQKFSDFEIILIDDGSTDKSGRICDNYALEDSRIIAVHIPNSGVSIARNIGLETARGEFVIFIDSDDSINSSVFEKISFSLRGSSHDAVLCSFNYIDENSNFLNEDINEEVGVYSGEDAVYKYIKWDIKVRMGSFFLRRNVIENNSLRFISECKYGEDIEFIKESLIYGRQVAVKSEAIYNYRIHPQSAMHNINFDRFDTVYSRLRFRDFIKEKFPYNTDLLILTERYSLPEAIIANISLLCRNGVDYRDIEEYLNKNNLYSILNECLENENTPYEFKNEIGNWVKNPFVYSLKWRLKNNYFEFRQLIGINKQKIFALTKGKEKNV